MAEYALTSAPYRENNAAYKRHCILPLFVTFSGGAPAVNAARSANGFTVALGGTGIITGVAPRGARGMIQAQMQTASNSQVVTINSYNPLTGAFSITVRTSASGAAVTPTNGDEIWLLFAIEGG